jgi:hypothetical protein
VRFDVSRDLAVPPARAWRVLTDTTTWSAWGPSIADVVASDRVLTATTTGRVRPRFGPWLPFRVTHLDPGSRWVWRVAGVPATGHRVEPTPTGCRIVFEVPYPAAAYAVVCEVALGRLAQLLEDERGQAATGQ